MRKKHILHDTRDMPIGWFYDGELDPIVEDKNKSFSLYANSRGEFIKHVKKITGEFIWKKAADWDAVSALIYNEYCGNNKHANKLLEEYRIRN